MTLKIPSNKKIQSIYYLLFEAVYENGLVAEDIEDYECLPINIFSTGQIINIIIAETAETRPVIVRKIQALEVAGFLKYKHLTIKGAIWILKITDNSGKNLEWPEIKSIVSTGKTKT